MKVLHVIQTLATRYGGPVASLKALAIHQVCEGQKVTICTTDSDYPRGTIPTDVGQSLLNKGIAVLFHPVQFRPLLFSFSFRNWIRSSVGDFDIVHIHGLYRFPVTYAARAARKAGVPYVITPHGALDPFLYRQSRYSLLLKRIYEQFFEFPNMRSASAINYTTQEELERAKFLGFTTPAIVVPIGLDWSEYVALPKRGGFRKSIGVDLDVPIVLFLGRLNFKKGLDLLIPAFSVVAKNFSKARLAVVGPDNEGFGKKIRQMCREYGIETSIVFVDHLTAEQVSQAYVDADVFVLPSYSENFGRTVVEAMACSCPVIVSDQVNIWQEVDKAQAGIVVRLEIQEIACAILNILQKLNMAKRMGRAGRELARRRFTYDRITEKVTHMYEAVLVAKTQVIG